MIRPATVRDVPAIARLINSFAERGLMLFRSHAELYETLRDFILYEKPEPESRNPEPVLLGVCALEIAWADLAEVKSLAVDPAHHGRGIGSQLVTAVMEEARRLQIQRLFALTYEQRFFERLGFHVVEKDALPLKVWSDCIKCPKKNGCDEIAVVKTLFDAPAVSEDDPNQFANLRYDVPTPIVQLKTPPPGNPSPKP
jgi:amino-acid N-acetyltransferase